MPGGLKPEATKSVQQAHNVCSSYAKEDFVIRDWDKMLVGRGKLEWGKEKKKRKQNTQGME